MITNEQKAAMRVAYLEHVQTTLEGLMESSDIWMSADAMGVSVDRKRVADEKMEMDEEMCDEINAICEEVDTALSETVARLLAEAKGEEYDDGCRGG